MWICLALFRHCSQAQVFQPLPSLQPLVTFHLPGHGAAGNKSKIWGRQQDCVISQKVNWLYIQTGTLPLYLLDLPLIPADHFFSRTKIQTIDYIDWLSNFFVNAFQNSAISDWENKTNKTKTSQTIPNFRLHLGVLIRHRRRIVHLERASECICNGIRANKWLWCFH